jgi:hypothetical protein
VNTRVMTIDFSWILALLPPALAAAAGAYFSARLGVAHADRAEASQFRRDSAEDLVSALTTLRDL